MRRSMLALCAALIAACGGDPTQPRREILPEMVDAVPYESFSQSGVTRDGKTMMRPPEGTIPRGRLPFRYGSGPEEAARAGRELASPIAATPQHLKRGEALFRTYCVPCHGREGLGDGPVIPKFPTPPSLVAPHAKALPDGQVFHIISRGQGLMPSHAAQIVQEDRWMIVAHVRKLQGAGKGAQP